MLKASVVGKDVSVPACAVLEVLAWTPDQLWKLIFAAGVEGHHAPGLVVVYRLFGFAESSVVVVDVGVSASSVNLVE